MSVQSEITRLENAKAAIQTAIAGKGVTVPDGTLLDGMAALIESIEAGSGGGGGRAFASGSFTLSADTIGYTITHDLGEVPYFCLVFCKNTISLMDSPSYAVFAVFGFSESIGSYNNFGIQGSTLGVFSDLITVSSYKRPLYDATSTTVSIRSSSYTLVGGKEYHWIAIGA